MRAFMLFLHDANKCKNDRNLLDFEQSIYTNACPKPVKRACPENGS
jgi:hypothetical protein